MKKIIELFISFILVLSFGFSFSYAHEVRPAYLEVKERAPKEYQVFWKVPQLGGAPLKITPKFSNECLAKNQASHIRSNGYDNYRWFMSCAETIKGATITLDGLEDTVIEVIARISDIEGKTETQRAYRGQNSIKLSESSQLVNVIKTYTLLGIDHILLGFDHLCFVLALLLLINNRKRLLGAVTAFTLGHSITLAAAALGFLSAPSQPIEAFIAFSIVMIAAEALTQQKGKQSLVAKNPWLVTVSFGLLHGFGFAGALSETGLPQDAILPALLFFNVGIEIGQIIFILFILFVIGLIKKFIPKVYPYLIMGLAYAIGIMAAFWTIERIVGFFT